MEMYYYNQLSKQAQIIYYAILKGIKDLEKEFLIPACEGKMLYDIFFQVRLDHPEIFWATSFKYKRYIDSSNLIFVPEYLFEKGKIQEHQKAMRARVEKLIRPAKDMSDLAKERYVHDFICQNVCYDKLKKSYSHEIIGPLGQGVGVCEGIAKSVKILLDALNVPCIIALCGNNPEKGIKYRHTWNIIKIEGKCYHMDATFDLSLTKNGNNIRYDYFNLSDQQIFKDHEPLIIPAPVCSDPDHFYYKEKKISLTKQEDVYKRALQAAKKGKSLTFHWRGGYLTRDILTQLAGEIRRAGEQKQKKAVIHVNWSQAVLHVCYQEQLQEMTTNMPDVTGAIDTADVTLEDANISEQCDCIKG